MAKAAVRETKESRALKQKLIVAGKILVAAGQADFTRGHISVRLPGNPGLFLMKPHSIGLDEITMANILTIDLEGNVVAGKARRHSEVYIHSEILKARPDINSVIHAHPTYSVALSASGHSVKAYSQPGALFYEDIGVYTDTIALIRSHELGAGVAKALGPHRAAFLKSHGTAVVGKTIEETVISAIMLENAAMIQMIVEAAGDPAPEFSRDEVLANKRQLSAPEQFVINFDYLGRKVSGRKR
jgi:L-fuculose-phosphate aldolase